MNQQNREASRDVPRGLAFYDRQEWLGLLNCLQDATTGGIELGNCSLKRHALRLSEAQPLSDDFRGVIADPRALLPGRLPF
jgi:hypothetical protein